ncbi:MAG: SEC-C domain-containing protein [Chitinophagales bacterium]|jgi:hypothetical protein|nr:SEC-C domain-containing protein [Chitinophagales bacterium]
MFENQLHDVLAKYPKLLKQTSDSITFLKGNIDIVDGVGKVWDTYEIEIHFKHEFPNRFPQLFEVGGKIPKNLDWHIYNDGSCCVTVFPNELLVCKQGITILGYVEDFVIPYLANQTYKKLTGDFANGEYSHGFWGVLEFYQDLLQTKDFRLLIDRLNWILNNSKPDRTNTCFCGSNKKFRHCHSNAYKKINIIGRDLVYADFENIILWHKNAVV